MKRCASSNKSLLGRLLDFVCPQQCVMCGSPEPDEPVCHLCRPYLPFNDTFCERCAAPLDARQPAGVPCAGCQANPPPFTAARAPFRYEFPVDSAIKSLKFDGKLYYSPALARYLLPELGRLPQDVDALLPVPLHRWRHARRGFNQAIELCRPLRRASGLRILTNVKRVRPTKPQSGLTATERRRNLRNAFAVVGPLRSHHPLIVDDVITTGATCRQLAQTLLNNGAGEVTVLSVARSASPPQRAAT